MKTPTLNPAQSNDGAAEARIAALEAALLRVFRHFDTVTRIAPDEVREDAREAHRAVEEIIYDVGLAHRVILGGAMNLVNGIGTLRNRFSDAHAPGGKIPVKPSARHAALAVNMAGAMATFMIETLVQQEGKAAA